MKTKTSQATWNMLAACFVRDHSLKVCATLSLLAGSALAGSRSSANYTVLTDATDGGGRRATSASYTNDGSVGLVAGVSTATAPHD